MCMPPNLVLVILVSGYVRKNKVLGEWKMSVKGTVMVCMEFNILGENLAGSNIIRKKFTLSTYIIHTFYAQRVFPSRSLCPLFLLVLLIRIRKCEKNCEDICSCSSKIRCNFFFFGFYKVKLVKNDLHYAF